MHYIACDSKYLGAQNPPPPAHVVPYFKLYFQHFDFIPGKTFFRGLKNQKYSGVKVVFLYELFYFVF